MKQMLRPILLVVFLFVSLILTQQYLPQGGQDVQYYPAQVMQIVDQGNTVKEGIPLPYQTVKLRYISGPLKDREELVELGKESNLANEQMLSIGDKVVLSLEQQNGVKKIQIGEQYRLPMLYWFIGGFLCIVCLFAGWQGLGALVGLVFSFLMIIGVLVPQIIAGHDPVFWTVIVSSLIMIITMYTAHGWKRATHVSVLATALTLIIAGIASYVAVQFLHLTGMGSEDANLLRLTQTIPLQGILLSSMILGILGILDDVTTSQIAAVFALRRANTTYSATHLIHEGLQVGREHIASLVNTLVLAYAGASFPLFIFFVLNPTSQPAWVILNNEFIIEEVVRMTVGSIALILAVPIATILGSFIVPSQGSGDHSHE